MRDEQKFWVNALCAVGAALLVIVAVPTIGKTVVSELAGLAVAQSSTQWNNVRDMSAGDSLSSGIMATMPYVFNGLTADRVRGDSVNGMDVDVTRIGGDVTPADGYANPTTANQMWALQGLFNGSTWDRARSPASDAQASTGVMAAGNMLFSGATWSRERTVGFSDNFSPVGISAAGNVGFDGANWDRTRAVSDTNNTATTSQGTHYSAQLQTWTETDAPASGVQANISKVAGGGTVRHVATFVSACLTSAASIATTNTVTLLDGAVALASWRLSTENTSTHYSQCINVTGLNITGSANTAMTLAFSVAPPASVLQAGTLGGYSTP